MPEENVFVMINFSIYLNSIEKNVYKTYDFDFSKVKTNYCR